VCNRCKLADPDWPFRYCASLAARLPVIPPWWQALTEFAAARHHHGGAVTILRHAGRVICAGVSAGPRQILAAATRVDGTYDAAGRALAAFFTGQGLILPGDEASRRAAARRQRYLDAVPARCTRRVPCSMKNSMYRRRRNTVSTWKKSAAKIVFACASRNARHACPARLGAGSMPASLRICHTVDGASLCPKPASSPWMRR
jgi:hypothetical protein